MRFRADHTVEYLQDINGNRITAGFTAGQLTSLTHSSGGSIAITYNGAGLIGRITSFATAADITGRTISYTYDATNTYLSSATGPEGTTSYTYDTGSNPASKNALLSVTDPGGVTQSYEYDAQGRLIATSLTGNVQRVTYSYHLGSVTATDAGGIASTNYFDDRGLVVR